MPELSLEATNICKSFSGVQVLDNVSFSVNCGEIHCLIGENGCGKSTLIKIISGVHTPTAGTLYINGTQYRGLRPIDAIREGVQVIYQDFSLFPNLSVAENIALNGELAENKRFVSWRKIKTKAKLVLDRIGANINPDSLVQDLSVADKQLVAICRALAQDAKLIIMDEPTTALTEKEVRSLFKITKQLQSTGMSIVFVSHKLNEVFEISDRITVVRNGKNVASGDVASFTRDGLVQLMTGREIVSSVPEPITHKESDKSLLKVENLYRKGTFIDISFELFRGEILGVTGVLGSGRTELALALFGIKLADSGFIYMDGERVKIRSIDDAIRLGIAYVPEDRLTEGLFLTQSISKNMAVGSVERLKNKLGFVNYRSISAEVDKWVENLRIATVSVDLPVNSLSGGNQQRVVLGKWLARSPRILILNGPTVGVDVGSKEQIHLLLKNLAKRNIGIIVISDDLPELMSICNRVLLMRKGRVVDEFLTHQISEDELAERLAEGGKGVAL